MHFNVEVEPRFDYGRATADIAVADGGAIFASPDLTLSLSAPVSVERTEAGVRAGFVLDHGQSATFVLEHGEQPRPYSEDGARELYNETVDYWLRWIAAARYQGRWREIVNRSALTLKLLTYRRDRRDRRRPDHQSARTGRRRAQLGLPLHVDSRRSVLAVRADAARVHRGGRSVRGWLTDRFRDGRNGTPGRSR